MDQVSNWLFEVVAVNREDVIKDPSSATDTALVKVKIRVKKRDATGVSTQGVISLPKMKHIKGYPEKIRVVRSDQTILSFNMITEPEHQAKPHRKSQSKFFHLFKTGKCLSSQGEDSNDPPYTLASMESKDINIKSKELLSDIESEKTSFSANKCNISTSQESPLFFLGKCKRGGCLDPPFGEDKYKYQPVLQQKKLLNIIEKEKYNKVTTKKAVKNNTIHSDVKVKPSVSVMKINLQETEISTLIIYKAKSEKCLIDENYSDSIITYPPEIVAGNLDVSEKKIMSRKSRQSQNQDDRYFTPSKTDKSLERNQDRSIRNTKELNYIRRSKDVSLSDIKGNSYVLTDSNGIAYKPHTVLESPGVITSDCKILQVPDVAESVLLKADRISGSSVRTVLDSDTKNVVKILSQSNSQEEYLLKLSRSGIQKTKISVEKINEDIVASPSTDNIMSIKETISLPSIEQLINNSHEIENKILPEFIDISPKQSIIRVQVLEKAITQCEDGELHKIKDSISHEFNEQNISHNSAEFRKHSNAEKNIITESDATVNDITNNDKEMSSNNIRCNDTFEVIASANDLLQKIASNVEHNTFPNFSENSQISFHLPISNDNKKDSVNNLHTLQLNEILTDRKSMDKKFQSKNLDVTLINPRHTNDVNSITAEQKSSYTLNELDISNRDCKTKAEVDKSSAIYLPVEAHEIRFNETEIEVKKYDSKTLENYANSYPNTQFENLYDMTLQLQPETALNTSFAETKDRGREEGSLEYIKKLNDSDSRFNVIQKSENKDVVLNLQAPTEELINNEKVFEVCKSSIKKIIEHKETTKSADNSLINSISENIKLGQTDLENAKNIESPKPNLNTVNNVLEKDIQSEENLKNKNVLQASIVFSNLNENDKDALSTSETKVSNNGSYRYENTSKHSGVTLITETESTTNLVKFGKLVQNSTPLNTEDLLLNNTSFIDVTIIISEIIDATNRKILEDKTISINSNNTVNQEEAHITSPYLPLSSVVLVNPETLSQVRTSEVKDINNIGNLVDKKEHSVDLKNSKINNLSQLNQFSDHMFESNQIQDTNILKEQSSDNIKTKHSEPTYDVALKITTSKQNLTGPLRNLLLNTTSNKIDTFSSDLLGAEEPVSELSNVIIKDGEVSTSKQIIDQDNEQNISLTKSSNSMMSKFNEKTKILKLEQFKKKESIVSQVLPKEKLIGNMMANLGFQTYINDNNDTILRTFDSLKSPQRFPHDSISVIKSVLKMNGSQISFAVNSETRMAIKIYSNKNSIQARDGSVEVNEGLKVKMEPIDIKNNEILQNSLAAIYENNLVPVEKIIKRLIFEIDNISKYCEELKKIHAKKNFKISKSSYTKMKCQCIRK